MKITYKVTEQRKRQIISYAWINGKSIEGVYYEGCKLIKCNNKLIIL